MQPACPFCGRKQKPHYRRPREDDGSAAAENEAAVLREVEELVAEGVLVRIHGDEEEEGGA
jgi:hypothetical protein